MQHPCVMHVRAHVQGMYLVHLLMVSGDVYCCAAHSQCLAGEHSLDTSYSLDQWDSKWWVATIET